MSLPLFQTVEQREGPIAPSESVFQFLQRGGRAEVIPIRQWMERAFRSVSAQRRHALKQRLKDTSFEVFFGAYFELQVHDLLCGCQCSFEYEPEEPANYPADFRIAQGDDRYGLEATTFVRNLRLNEEDFLERLQSAMELTDKLRRMRLSLNLRVKGQLVGEVRKQARVDFIKALCRAVDDPNRPRGSAWDPPNAQIKCGDWHCEGRLWSSGGPGGFINPPSRLDEEALSPGAIRKKLRRKQLRWRKFWENHDLECGPFLVATSVDFLVDSNTVKAALYGSSSSNEQDRLFVRDLHRTNAVVVFHNAALGAEQGASVQLYRNGNEIIPNCLMHLMRRQPLPELIRI